MGCVKGVKGEGVEESVCVHVRHARQRRDHVSVDGGCERCENGKVWRRQCVCTSVMHANVSVDGGCERGGRDGFGLAPCLEHPYLNTSALHTSTPPHMQVPLRHHFSDEALGGPWPERHVH